jgi:hypothetical protein
MRICNGKIQIHKVDVGEQWESRYAVHAVRNLPDKEFPATLEPSGLQLHVY